MTPALLSHVAILVPSVRKAAQRFEELNFKIGSAERWEGEKTLEIYVGDIQHQRGTLLLMEPAGEGAYSRALKKRGPGLHHLGIDVLNLDSFIESISGSGWLLHPKSLKTMKATQTAYLARPGMPALIEVQAQAQLIPLPYLVRGLKIRDLPDSGAERFSAIGLSQITGHDAETILEMNDHKILLRDLY